MAAFCFCVCSAFPKYREWWGHQGHQLLCWGVGLGRQEGGEAQRVLQVWEVSVYTWLRGDGAGKEMDLCFQGWGCRMG